MRPKQTKNQKDMIELREQAKRKFYQSQNSREMKVYSLDSEFACMNQVLVSHGRPLQVANQIGTGSFVEDLVFKHYKIKKSKIYNILGSKSLIDEFERTHFKWGAEHVLVGDDIKMENVLLKRTIKYASTDDMLDISEFLGDLRSPQFEGYSYWESKDIKWFLKTKRKLDSMYNKMEEKCKTIFEVFGKIVPGVYTSLTRHFFVTNKVCFLDLTAYYNKHIDDRSAYLLGMAGFHRGNGRVTTNLFVCPVKTEDGLLDSDLYKIFYHETCKRLSRTSEYILPAIISDYNANLIVRAGNQTFAFWHDCDLSHVLNNLDLIISFVSHYYNLRIENPNAINDYMLECYDVSEALQENGIYYIEVLNMKDMTLCNYDVLDSYIKKFGFEPCEQF